jgi:hypothetical protein
MIARRAGAALRGGGPTQRSGRKGRATEMMAGRPAYAGASARQAAGVRRGGEGTACRARTGAGPEVSGPAVRNGRGQGRLVDEAQTVEIFIFPPGISDHGTQGADGKSVAGMVVGHDHSPAVGVAVDVVAAADPAQGECIGL